MAEKDIDQLSGIETTGHEWDGIKELNNPLPRWWLWTFYATVIWSIGYVIAYPAIPLISTATSGVLGYSSRAEVADEITKAKVAQSGLLSRIESSSLEEIRKTPELLQFARAGGKSAFGVNCVQCHGSGAAGSPGYPNLNDDDWIWGGNLEAIYVTIKHGIRFQWDDDTRASEMPAFGADELLEKDQIWDTAAYVRKLAGLEHDAGAAERGAPIYVENCAACHKETGEGDQEQGAPNLKDAIWHYGKTTEEIVAQISKPRHGVMPGWVHRLDDNTIKQLTVYVHSLGGGE
ncbi:MAG: cytochrome-c oxidase, cbb3-type subunit III [Pseudomonadota bacterium]